MSITIFVIDEYASILTPTRSLLETQRDFAVVGEAADRQSAASAVALCHPDIVVLNLTLPIDHSLDLVQRIRALCPSTPVILLALFLKNEEVRQAVNAGVEGFVSYEAITSELVRAIRQVVVGQHFVSRNLLEGGVEPSHSRYAQPRRFAFSLAERAATRRSVPI
ncbi:MAG TPA: response regulator transcription factor [Caldilineaceae bacterium]|mgnify:CR=1 FL=1|nr:response regulator transcription factor [Caldilineaceae bacterium]